ncbi:unnamed protein product [Enterobius vermicularis]|uniref:Uncharacterized protein n=1 Tax=Enterobius vermicularis TaxID=51028 RepID=A0A0N4VI80_ENTVE|nr:unnamed protein product [Enterobius vermicularis]
MDDELAQLDFELCRLSGSCARPLTSETSTLVEILLVIKAVSSTGELNGFLVQLETRLMGIHEFLVGMNLR